MEANLRILQSFKKINEKINDNEEKQKEINKKIDDFLKDISKEIKEIDNENQDLKKELSETIEKVKQEKPKDGKDGKDGRDGKDGYTPVKGKDYFDGKDGVDGLDGKNGVDGKNGKDGKDGQNGEDGIGIYDIEINDKGELIITLTNGKKINCGVVKGKDGVGYAGVSVTNAKIVNGELIITLSTGREINAGKVATEGTNIDLTGYATEEWVENQDYIPMTDFKQIMDTFYYQKDQVYNKEEIDETLKDLPTGGTELTGGDNTVIEDNAINVYTNTGYKVIDKDIQLQSITDTETTGTNKIVYAEDKEIMFVIDGTNKLRKSENGIDFEVLTMPRTCKDMLYMNGFNRLVALSNDGYFFYSDDLGLNWTEKQSNFANGASYLFRQHEFNKSFGVININNKTITSLNEDFIQSSNITSSIAPNFWAKVNDTQFVWCNNIGTFKYGAGSREVAFASLSGVTVNLLKRVNDITILGLKNDNRIYLLEPAITITTYKWIEHTLLDTCTVNDIIFNPYDETYYIFTDINTYYKTKDFVEYESVDKNNLRGIQGSFTLEGIQMTTSNHNELLLAPTRTKIENKAQEWDRAVNKSLWLGKGLKENEQKKVDVITSDDVLGVSDDGIFLREVDELHLTLDIIESLYVAKAKLKEAPLSPYEFDGWFWEFGIPYDGLYMANKIVFSEAGSFIHQFTYEEEYVVEQYEYGYIFCDSNMSIFKYVKLGNLSWFLNKGE